MRAAANCIERRETLKTDKSAISNSEIRNLSYAYFRI